MVVSPSRIIANLPKCSHCDTNDHPANFPCRRAIVKVELKYWMVHSAHTALITPQHHDPDLGDQRQQLNALRLMAFIFKGNAWFYEQIDGIADKMLDYMSEDFAKELINVRCHLHHGLSRQAVAAIAAGIYAVARYERMQDLAWLSGTHDSIKRYGYLLHNGTALLDFYSSTLIVEEQVLNNIYVCKSVKYRMELYSNLFHIPLAVLRENSNQYADQKQHFIHPWFSFVSDQEPFALF